MTNSIESVYPGTAAHLAAARRIPNHPWQPAYANIGAIMAERLQLTPDSPFLTYLEDSQRLSWSYRQFADLALRAAAFMQNGDMRIGPGDRVATLCVNDPRTVVVYFGAWLLGACVVPVNCTEDDDRIAYILSNAGVKGVFAMSDQLARLESIAGSCAAPCVEIDEIGGSFDYALGSISPLPIDALPEVGPDAECLIVYTSGTTGAPKGVALEQSNLMSDAQSIAEWHGFGPADRAMLVLPIHHVNGTVVTLMTPFYTGGSVVLNRKFSAARYFQTIADEGCTWASVVPTVLAFLCERSIDLSSIDMGAFRHIICGAGPLTVELAQRFHNTYGVRVVHGYGLSETTCYSCFLPVDLNEAAFRHWMFECGFPSIGCAISANEMDIHDSVGHPLPADVRGEIVIRGYNVMRHYFQRPDANRDTFEHSWFRSGDEGFYREDADGRRYYFITGRLKELFIRGGINYSPFDIDEVLNAIPGVKAAMAVGFENNFYGEEIGAYVQLAEGATLTADDIMTKCRQELPFAKSPKVVVFGTEFPVTSTGKYQRNRLKPLFAAWKNSQFREQKG